MIKIVLTNIPIKCGIVDSNVNRFIYSRDWAMVLHPYDAEVIWCGVVSSLGAVCMDQRGFLQVLLIPFPQDPGCFTYVFFIACKFPTLVHVNGSTLLVHRVLVLGFD